MYMSAGAVAGGGGCCWGWLCSCDAPRDDLREGEGCVGAGGSGAFVTGVGSGAGSDGPSSKKLSPPRLKLPNCIPIPFTSPPPNPSPANPGITTGVSPDTLYLALFLCAALDVVRGVERALEAGEEVRMGWETEVGIAVAGVCC